MRQSGSPGLCRCLWPCRPVRQPQLWQVPTRERPAVMSWFHGLLPHASRAAAFVYYRVRYAGDPVPPRGPVLLVANHPNSLFDPILVMAAARRPVRVLAKAPLFADFKTAWFVKAGGAIPVYRRSDDPAQMDKNEDAFRAVYDALAGGSAVGIFPEGLSHSEPSMAPLKTGAARMALGGAKLTGAAFPVVPVGLLLASKDEFRSEALVLTGPKVEWDDLAARGPDDAVAVRELTERIAGALRGVTLNLERWQDRPLVEFVVAIWDAEQGLDEDAPARVSRLEAATELLAAVRRHEDAEAEALAPDLERHRRRLKRLRLGPGHLRADTGLGQAIGWAARRAWLVLPAAAVLAAFGFVAFFPPYFVTGFLVGRVKLKQDERSTWKLLLGMGIYLIWLLALGVAAALARDALAAVLVMTLLPAIGLVGLAVRERWRGAWSDARRFFLLRSRRELVASLLAEQQHLAGRLKALYERYRAAPELR